MDLRGDQAGGFQFLECLAHGHAADVVFRGDGPLNQGFAVLEFTVEDALAQRLGEGGFGI